MEAKFVMPGEGDNINVLGDNQYVKVTGEDSGGAYALVEQINPIGAGIPLHVHHNEEETFYIIEGTYEFKTEGKTVLAPAGSTVHLPRDVPHEFKVVEGSQLNPGAPARALVWLCPAGGEKMFLELSRLSMPPDMPTAMAICARYGIEFL